MSETGFGEDLASSDDHMVLLETIQHKGIQIEINGGEKVLCLCHKIIHCGHEHVALGKEM